MDGAAARLVGLHGHLLRRISAAYNIHFEGLGVATRRLSRYGALRVPLKRRLLALDNTVSFLRHVTQPLCDDLVVAIEIAIGDLALDSCSMPGSTIDGGRADVPSRSDTSADFGASSTDCASLDTDANACTDSGAESGSGHGTCVFVTTDSGLPIRDCRSGFSNCSAVCRCWNDFNMSSSCSVPNNVIALKQSYRVAVRQQFF